MNKSRAMLFSAVLVTVAFGGTAMAGTSVSFMAGAGTGVQSAVFASYLVNYPMEDATMSLNTAISVSNIMMAPDGIMAGGYGDNYQKMGSLEFYLYNQDGSMVMYETNMDSKGTGLEEDGTLMPGATYTVHLSEILMAAGADPMFIGYGWVVANFDAVAGTRTVTSYGLGFSQHGDLTPTVDHSGDGGLNIMMMDDMMDME
jgi:hypothetical protein